jgi:hypothetical protein
MFVCHQHAVEDEAAEVVEGSRLTFSRLHDTVLHKIELFNLCLSSTRPITN